MTRYISDQEFELEVLQSQKPVLLCMSASWCGPCKMLAPILDEISQEIQDIKILKMDVDTSPKIPSELGVRSIPMMFIFQNGKQIESKVGGVAKESLKKWIESFL